MAEPTVLDRLTAAGLSAERAQEHLAAGLVRVDGQVADGPEHLAPLPSRVVIDGAEEDSRSHHPSGITRRCDVLSVTTGIPDYTGG